MNKILYEGDSSKFNGILFNIVAEPGQSDAEVGAMVISYLNNFQDIGPREIKVDVLYRDMAVLGEVPYELYGAYASIIAASPVGRPEVYTESLGYRIGHLNIFQSGFNHIRLPNMKYMSVHGMADYGNFNHSWTSEQNTTLMSEMAHWLKEKARTISMGGLSSTPVVAFSTDNNGVKIMHDMGLGIMFDRRPTKIRVGIYNNIAEAFDQDMHFLKAAFLLPHTYYWSRSWEVGKTKLKAFFLKNTLIVADNNTVVDTLMPHLVDSQSFLNEYDIIYINQYTQTHSNGHILINPSSTGANNIMLKCAGLTILNKERITGYRPDRGYENTRTYLSGTVMYKTRNRTFNYTMKMYPNEPTRISHYILPYEKDSEALVESFKYIDEMMHLRDGELLSSKLQDYPVKFLITADESDDVLVKWFNMASSNAQSDEEKLKIAYERLKEELVREYKEVEIYLAHNNMANKKPIPAIELGDTVARSIRKKVSFGKLPRRLHSVGRQELNNAINYDVTNVAFMLPNKRGKDKFYFRGNTTLDKLYNKKTNVITINEIELMKGMDREC